MNVHEYQAKELLQRFQVPLLKGKLALTPDEAVQAAKEIGGSVHVVKAQIHAGGRGKAGGVKVAKNLDDVEKDMIQKALDKYNGNISKAAKELGLTRASLYRRLEKYGL